MNEVTSVDGLIDAIIDREGGYVNIRPTRAVRPASGSPKRSLAPTVTQARCANSRAPKRSPSIAGSIGSGRASTNWPGAAVSRSRAVRTGRQHGSGGRGHVPAARADRAQSQCQGLSRPDAGWPDRRRDPRRARPVPRGPRGRAARPCFCARSKRSRANVTSAWPNGARPTRPSSTAGWRTALVKRWSAKVTKWRKWKTPRFHPPMEVTQ